uniref:CDH-like cytochrome protein n=1 Tax=Penicillium brasilianum TaxID=104259 RepID=A0A650CA52_PENBI|nr:CDH-like cytochrome protein [Penicillium brasilianum]
MKQYSWIGLTVATSLFIGIEGQPARFHPSGRNDISFTIATSETSNDPPRGDLLLQIQAPDSVQWIGIGSGNQMAGANIFVVYASSATNVVVSPREGTGHVPPLHNAENHITVLPGTGIANGTITARFKWKDFLDAHWVASNATDSASSWIWAYKNGPPLLSEKVSAPIEYHDAFGRELVDLRHAQSTSNFNIEDGVFTDSSSPEIQNLPYMATAHGYMMAVAFVLLFPTFALLVPLSSFITIPVISVHAPLQGLALATAIAGAGLGLKMWIGENSQPAAHPIIGIIVVATLTFIQPALGWAHHLRFKRNGEKSYFSFGHRWLGRSMLALGVINGGLGFWWEGPVTGSLKTGMVIYAVIAGVVCVVYLILHLFIRARFASRREHVQGIRLEDASAPSSKRADSWQVVHGQ